MRTLHMQVDCNIYGIPVEMCELSQLQMLNLSENFALHEKGCSRLAKAPLHKVVNLSSMDIASVACFSAHLETGHLDPGLLSVLRPV